MRYRARYVNPDGTERSQSFPDRKKREAELWIATVDVDLARGDYLDPRAGKTTFGHYAADWIESQTSNVSTRENNERNLRLHAYPYFGARELGSLEPGDVRRWMRALQDKRLALSTQRLVWSIVSAVFNSAVDDGKIKKNPCRADSLRKPRPEPRRVIPWPKEQLAAVRHALPKRCQAMVDVAAGCGLRQGEVFGLGVDDVDFVSGLLKVNRQVKIIQNRFALAPPKGGKTRVVPLAESVASALAEHMRAFPPLQVTLPWVSLDGGLVTARLVFSTRYRRIVNRKDFNDRVWRPALATAGVIAPPDEGWRCEPSRENGIHALRHLYASTLLDAGETIKAVSEYLGHSDPGFTLRTYTHLMPTSQTRARAAVDGLLTVLHDSPVLADGPKTAPGRD
jgi:integrase